MITIGVDPGLTGFVCFLDDSDCRPDKKPSPLFYPCPTKDGDFDEHGMIGVVNSLGCGPDYKVQLVLIEEQQAFPGKGPRCPVCHKPKQQQGTASSFKGGEGFGLWKGIFKALGFVTVTVRPSVWKASFGLDSDKKKSVAKAQQLAPTVDFLRTPRCRVPDHNKAEAYLLAVYARKLLERNK